VGLFEREAVGPDLAGVQHGKVVTHSFPLEKIHEAFEVMDAPERGKVLIVQE